MAHQDQHRAPWTAVVGTLAAAAAVLVCQVAGLLPTTPSIGGLTLAALTCIVGAATSTRAVVTAYRLAVIMAGSAWATVTAWLGWSPMLAVVLLGGGGGLAILGLALPRNPVAAPAPPQPDAVGGRPSREQQITALLRRITKSQGIACTRVEPWARAGDGYRCHVDLPEGMTTKMLADFADRIAASPALRLPEGCTVRVLNGSVQCEAILDVMSRDCLQDYVAASPDATPASINDEFPVMSTPRGDLLTVCLRIKSMIVGGTTGSGKTTLLHVIIMHLARCTDALIWVMDPNGGGAAVPWIDPWLEGRAKRPIVDWVAATEEEAAAMTAVMHAVIKDRKTSPQAKAARRAAGTNVLPVSPALPAIVLITDEGGELAQATTLFGQVAVDRISRIAQIGRESAGRTVQCVLRGTADLLDKGLRAVTGNRICLRMDEEGEVDHVIGRNPGRTPLLHTGSAWLYRSGVDQRPVLGKTVDATPAQIDAHAITCAGLRPELDARGQQIAARVTPAAVLGWTRIPADRREMLQIPVMRDAAAGQLYVRRWDRYRAYLAGDDAPAGDMHQDDEAAPTVATPGSAMESLLVGTGVLRQQAEPQQRPAGVDQADVDSEAAALLSDEHLQLTGSPAGGPARLTTRERIVGLVRDAHPHGLTSAQIGALLDQAGASVARQTRQELLRQLVDLGKLGRGEAGTYVLP